MRILLVEDDALLGRALATGLSQGGYAPDWVQSAESGIEALATGTYAAVALDLNLPDGSGLDVLKHLRRNSTLPVVIMTARDALADRIEGLDLGADDYLVKPFDLAELLARLRAVIRRSEGRAQAVIVHGDLELDTSARMVKKAGQWLKLTHREYQILNLLLQRPGRILSRGDIEAQLYGWDDDVESNTVEAAVYALRKKVGRDLITTIRNVGYVIPS
jgi:two-component system OmpR family response regulator/two-component system response regulator QseB